MTIKTANIICIICVLLFGSTQVMLFASVDVNLKSSSVVDVCREEEKREVIISVNIGNVKVEDKLFGYELQLKFKKGRIKFFETLKINTLSEPCKYLLDEFTDSSANIQGLMGGVATPIFGNKALVAIIGHYTGECPDSVDIDIEYFDPVDGYTNTIGSLNGTKVIAVVAQKDDRYLSTSIDSNILKVVENKITVPFRYTTNPLIDNRLSKVTYKIEHNIPDRIELISINSKGGNAEVKNLEGSNGNFTFDLMLNSQETTNEFIASFQSLSNDDYNGIMYINALSVNECACATNFTGDSVTIIHKKDSVHDTTSAVDYFFENFKRDKIATKENEIFINNILINRELNIYDINGNVIYCEYRIEDTGARVNISHLIPGVYFIKYGMINNGIKRIMLIKY